MRKIFLILLCVVLTGCPGPEGPVNPINPDAPDNSHVDNRLVEELRSEFGEFGRKDAGVFGAFYVAFADYLETPTGVKFDTFLKIDRLGEDVRKTLNVRSSDYPQFKKRLSNILSGFDSPSTSISENDRKDFCEKIRTLGQALRVASVKK